MRPTLHLSLLAFLLLQLHSHANADCEPATCGNLTLRYPFWFGDSKLQTPSPCGHPAFEIWCAERSVASLRFTSFHVLDIDYANNSLIVSNTGVAAAGVCSTYFNMSINLSVGPFTIGHRNRALCFLHNCNGTAPSGPGYVNATSNCSAPIYAYLGGTYHWGKPPPEIAPGGCTYSYLPVLMQEAEITITAANYSRLLKDGFVLEWEMASVGDCDACAATGGQCRYNKSMMAAFWCLCPGGGRAELACADSGLADGVYELVPAAEEIAQESEVNVVHVDPSPEKEYRFEPEGPSPQEVAASMAWASQLPPGYNIKWEPTSSEDREE